MKQQNPRAAGGSRSAAGLQEDIRLEQGALCSHQDPDDPGCQSGIFHRPQMARVSGEEGYQVSLDGNAAQQQAADVRVCSKEVLQQS